MLRLLAMLVAAIAAFGGSYGAYAAVQAVGPDDRTNDFGYGDAATTSPGGGDLYESKNFALVIAALKRELGPDGRIAYMTLERSEASATARVGDREVRVEVDASGRSQSSVGETARPAALLPVSRLEAGAIDKIVRGSQRQSRSLVERLTLQGNTREWSVDMDGGEPDSYTANLDGGGLRLPGEPNPEPIGASPDSLLQTENLAKVIAAARKEAPADARVKDFDIRPDRVSFTLDAGGRELELDYGYDAQLTSRDLRAKSGAPTASVSWEAVDPEAPARMIRSASKLLRVKDLGDVQYVLISLPSTPGEGKPSLSMYFTEGHDPGYVLADLHGRKLTWPGRT
ncbi:hypothetical protein OM076_42280 [Solirubrobacter ginsenosidimutans]|uniref:DUF2092 domain-containing protein n=1 Tax=Solirubrobacter ginsenosidimutans TaxID=490573 RepID=A0A9X3S5M8_9ACTN|nr:hypothetical protein [Solirubrobacter ginsenosidimutans]MDA0166964.1 hypothetical protein [Solirubrobacter ginsenosidimutans]